MQIRAIGSRALLAAIIVVAPPTASAQYLGYNPNGPRPTANTQVYSGALSPQTAPAPSYNPPVPFGSQYAFTQSPYGYVAHNATIDSLVNAQTDLAQQQVYQAKSDTRRKLFDEKRYEQMMTPTYEETRQSQMQQQYSQARNNPPDQTIWSGSALNDLTYLIRQTQASTGVRGPMVALDPQIFAHLNWGDGSSSAGCLSMIRNGADKLEWPAVLLDDQFRGSRQIISKSLDEAVTGTRLGSPDARRAVAKAQSELDNLREGLRGIVRQVSAPDYMDAVGFIQDLTNSLTSLKQPTAMKALSAPIEAADVNEYLDQVSQKGLRISPAAPADRSYYNALYNALHTYDLALLRMTGGFRPPPKPDDKGRFE